MRQALRTHALQERPVGVLGPRRLLAFQDVLHEVSEDGLLLLVVRIPFLLGHHLAVNLVNHVMASNSVTRLSPWALLPIMRRQASTLSPETAVPPSRAPSTLATSRCSAIAFFRALAVLAERVTALPPLMAA